MSTIEAHLSPRLSTVTVHTELSTRSILHAPTSIARFETSQQKSLLHTPCSPSQPKWDQFQWCLTVRLRFVLLRFPKLQKRVRAQGQRLAVLVQARYACLTMLVLQRWTPHSRLMSLSDQSAHWMEFLALSALHAA